MKLRLASALALSFAFSQIAIAPAMAEQAAPAPFRSVAPQTFSNEDLQRYGLSETDAAQVARMQADGYQVRVLSGEEADQYRAGQYGDRTMWIVIGGVILVLLVAAAVD